MNIDAFKAFITVEEDDSEVVIRMGWKTIARFEEQNGRWFISIDMKDCGRMLGYSSKEKALEGLIAYLTIDDQN
jgi:hypothetical protein